MVDEMRCCTTRMSLHCFARRSSHAKRKVKCSFYIEALRTLGATVNRVCTEGQLENDDGRDLE